MTRWCLLIGIWLFTISLSAQEITETVSPLEITVEVTAPSEWTETPTFAPLEATAEVTSVLLTEEMLTVLSPIIIVEATKTPRTWQILNGMAIYQNRYPDHAGITITLYDVQGNTLSQAITDLNGEFSLSAPVQETFWIVFSAPQHKATGMLLSPSQNLPQAVLRGGDINNDGCITQTDIHLLIDWFATNTLTGDINNDQLIDSGDFALVTSNLEKTCTPIWSLIAPVPTPTLTPTLEEQTPEVPNAEQTVFPEITLEPTPSPEFTPESNLEGNPTPEATSEVTVSP